jgi:hypothetical protein
MPWAWQYIGISVGVSSQFLQVALQQQQYGSTATSKRLTTTVVLAACFQTDMDGQEHSLLPLVTAVPTAHVFTDPTVFR